MITTKEQTRDKFYSIRHRNTDFIEITFQVTGECNFRCTYCYEEKIPQRMKLENALTVIDKFFSIEDNLDWWNGFLLGNTTKNHIMLNFFGGECFLEVDNMEAICQYFVDKCNENLEKYGERLKNLQIVCQTNGSLLKTAKVEAFIDKWQKYMTDIYITIDGCQKFHDMCRVFKGSGAPTWQLVHDNIMWCRKRFPNLPITTKGTIGPETLPYLFESYLAYKEMGFRNIRITLRSDSDVNWTEKDLEEARKQYRLIMDDLLKYPDSYYSFATWNYNLDDIVDNRNIYALGTCHSNGSGICVTVTDDLYICYNFSPVSIPNRLNRKPFILGTIKEGISDEGMKNADKIARMIDKYETEHDKCLKCLCLNQCEFCPAVNYKECGDIEVSSKKACEIKKIEQHYGMLYKYYREKLYENIN